MEKLQQALKKKKGEYEAFLSKQVSPIVKNPFTANYKFTLIPDEAVYLLSFESEFPMVKFFINNFM